MIRIFSSAFRITIVIGLCYFCAVLGYFIGGQQYVARSAVNEADGIATILEHLESGRNNEAYTLLQRWLGINILIYHSVYQPKIHDFLSPWWIYEGEANNNQPMTHIVEYRDKHPSFSLASETEQKIDNYLSKHKKNTP
jgi:hypothetical protein